MRSASSLVLLAALLLAAFCAVGFATPLDDYVNSPDPVYKWEFVDEVQDPLFKMYILNLTSQNWLTEKDTSRPVWYHWLILYVPPEVNSSYCFMYMTGGHDDESLPTKADPLMYTVALSSKTVVAELHQIPNEPITFASDPTHSGRSEDGMIAYTWKYYMDHLDEPDILARLPMTKAGVKAMDAIQEFTENLDGVPKAEKFVVGGGSKRGWNTYTVAAVDKRVVGIVPIVIPVLNVVENINHQWRAYGAWSFALDDYVEQNVTKKLNTPEFAKLASVVDPFVYRDRLTMPKLIVCATGDEFFLPDDPQFFFGDMKGESHLRMVPNAEHSLAGHQLEVAFELESFYHSLIIERPRPKLTWTIDPKDGTITMKASEKPNRVIMWRAHNNKARDFRLLVGPDPKKDIQPIFWLPLDLEDQGGYTYVAKEEMPEEGWKGFFIEAEFKLNSWLDPLSDHFFKFTTEVSIIPNTLPYPPCGQHCP